jgi:DNA-binding response OmpR family regulator
VTTRPAAISAAAGQRPGRLRALVVDDEPGLVEIVSAYLSREGFEVDAAADGRQAIELARRTAPEVIVLDLGLPGIDGLEACRQIRSFSDAYIVILTARAEEHEKIAGLSTGADDYLTKPFSPGELVARIRAMLRRPRSAAGSTAERRTFGPLELDPAAREVLVDDAPVELTKLEFDLLDVLTANPRLVFSRGQLLEQVWGPGWFGDDHLIDVHIANVRRKLGHPELIRTVRGVGYRIARA